MVTALDTPDVAAAPEPRSHRDVYDIITERICALLAEGVVPWRKAWRSAATLPTNLASMKAYRGVNVFLLGCAPFASPYWLTFRQARAAGGSVRRGAKAYPVIFWRWLDRPGAEADEQGRVSHHRYPLLRYFNVFNVEQCEGITAPAVEAPGHTFSPIEAAERIVAAMPNAPTIEHNGGSAYYRPATDTVSVPRAELFDEPGEYYCALYHELAHATGHESRLGRTGITDANAFASHAYSKEELVAEMAAAFLCGVAGIDNTLTNSAAYVDWWLRKLRDDRRMVVLAAAQAQKAADFILGRSANDSDTTADAD